MFAAGIAAGRIPDGDTVPGTQLRVDKAGADEISLSWSASCVAADTDYAVYEGSLTDLASHLPVACSTGNVTTTTLTPRAGDRYFLVVPTSSNREGAYGLDGSAQPRPPSGAACLEQYVAPCD